MLVIVIGQLNDTYAIASTTIFLAMKNPTAKRPPSNPPFIISISKDIAAGSSGGIGSSIITISGVPAVNEKSANSLFYDKEGLAQRK